MKEVIAIDADDVLFNENEWVRLFHNEQYGTAHTPEDYLVTGKYGSYWEDIWDADGAESNRRMAAYLEYKIKHHPEPMTGARQELERRRHRYHYVLNTSRPGDAFEATKAAIDLYYPGLFADIYLVSLWDTSRQVTKAEICLAIGASHLVDDSFEHASLAADAGIDAMLFGDMGWNRWQPLRAGMTRTRDWRAVGMHLDGQR